MDGLHNGQNLKEVILGEILLWVVRMKSPEVVDKDVKDAENQDQHNGTELGLESNNDHDASHEAKDADKNPPETPVSSNDKAYEEKDEQHTASQLEVHFAVFLVDLRETGRRESLAHPAVGKNHKEAAHDRKVTKEEVEVEDEAVTEGLCNHYSHESSYGCGSVLAGDN